MTDYASLFADRYGTALLADVAYRAGIEPGLPAPGLRPLDLRAKLAGPVVTVEANNDLVAILLAVHRARAGDVIMITNQTPDVGLMGDLIGAEAVRKGLAGFVVDGLVRDVVELIDLKLAVLCRGSYPVGPLKVPADDRGTGAVGGRIEVGGATVDPGMWIFGDADGLIVLDAADLPALFERAASTWEQEAQLNDEIASGTPLAEAFALDSFLRERGEDPEADFGAHLARLNRAI
jgi:4-hydroxy-4-methyl-2-oxoglutarate aldolase